MSQVQTAKGSANGGSFPLPAIVPDWSAIQRIATSGTSAASAAITANLVLVRSNVDCFISVGAAPTATTGTATSFPIVANELFALPLASGQKVAAITSGASGVLYLMPAKG